ncbi:hypothetical protein M0R19_01555 [Candidatus Pacearchaeota archaeon]|jgi:hypothetical protein|nr:hypothetical protein [Candidatus Pacearchaeota archaeon]
MKILKDKLRHLRRVLAPASLIAGIGLITLFGVPYCTRECTNNIQNIENSIEKLYPTVPYFKMQEQKLEQERGEHWEALLNTIELEKRNY